MARSWRARRETSIPARLGFSSRIAHTRHAARHRLAAASLLANDEIQQQSARRKAGQRRHHAVGKARNDHAAALLQAAIAVSRHLLGGARENTRKSVGGEARTRLKLGRHRAWAKHGDP